VELEQFLVKAKVSAYASGGEGEEGILSDGCKELAFQEGEYKYRDRYFGWNPFIGEEVVWHGDQVTWAMNYYGAVFNEVVPAGSVRLSAKSHESSQRRQTVSWATFIEGKRFRIL
jgi:hypothetical protein